MPKLTQLPNISARSNMSALLKLLVIQALLLSSIETSRILAWFPTPSISHQVVFTILTEELARRGHDITVVTTDPKFSKGKTPPNLTEIDVHDVSYSLWKKSFMAISKGLKSDIVKQTDVLFKALADSFFVQAQTEELQNIINNKNITYDLVLVEANVRPALVVTHIFKVPVIAVSSFGAVFGNYEMIGAPVHPILFPNMFRQRLHNLNMWEKVTEVYTNYKNLLTFQNKNTYENEKLREIFGPDTPGVDELRSNVDMLFLNVYPVFEGIRPVPPSVIHMGGLHILPPKPLPSDLKEYLDSSKNGVVYVSFGTNVDSTLLSAERVQILVKVFSRLPYNVLYKWDDDKLLGRGDNIKISKWLPQNDLLYHPNIKLFITQAGLQSTDEAIAAGVPLLGIPMLGDQWYNAEKYEFHGIGRQLDWETLTEERLFKTINEIITNESYRKNVAKLRAIMTDQPMTPLERAVWWIEYVIRHGGAKHLRSPSANISWAQYLELELLTVLLLTFLLILTIFITSVYFLLKYFMRLQIKLKKKIS